jgi:signal transduction histidine kinase
MKPGFRGPPTAVLIAVTAVIQLVGTSFAAAHQLARPLDVLAYALLLAGPALLSLRRTAPGPMAAGAAFATGSYFALGYPGGPVWLSLVVALFVAVRSRARWWAWGSLAGLVVMLLLQSLVSGSRVDAVRLGAGLAWLVIVAMVAELLASRAERSAERRRSEREAEQRRRNEERLMLARDIHDVVAHSLSMINVQASVALHLARKNPDPEQMAQSLEAIKSGSKEALSEVREVLSVLRQDAPRVPSQRLDQLPELLDHARRSGLQVSLDQEQDAGLPPGLAQIETAAFRAVQEAVTNIVRHARAHSLWVRIAVTGGWLEVTVDDDGAGLGGTPAGNGLRGMRERIETLGGELMVGDRQEGGTRVRARIPLPVQPAKGASGPEPGNATGPAAGGAP